MVELEVPKLWRYKNKVYCDDWLNNCLPSKSAKLIIADPPYFEVKGKFDFVWPSFDAYLVDVERWAMECKRVLADNGTLIWWGHAKKIAYSQIILDKYFSLLNSAVWRKVDCLTQKSGAENMRTLAPVTERLLIYDNGEIESAHRRILDNNTLFVPLKKYLDDWLEKSGLTQSELSKKIKMNVSHHLGFTLKEKVQFTLPTREKWDAMNSVYPHSMSYEDAVKLFNDLYKSYEPLAAQYEAERRYFKSDIVRPDVMLYIQESNLSKIYDHETIKPPTLTRDLINTTTQRGDLVVVPFAGSGTECAMSVKDGRTFIGFDINQKHVNTSNKRVLKILENPTLF